MIRPSKGTVETLLSDIGGAASGNQSFDLWVPNDLTLRGRPACTDIAMTIVLDKVRTMGFEPDGFVQTKNGRVYKYKAKI